MRVVCVKSFSANHNGEIFTAHEGMVFTLPEGVDWLEVGYVTPVEEPVMEEAVASAGSENTATGKVSKRK